MRTEAQIQASRANGRRSQGPVTPEGKARSSQNAFRHGLLAKTIVLAHEDEDCFQQYLDQHIDRFSPADDVEMNIIEEAVGAAWRERRCADLLTSAMDVAIEDAESVEDDRRVMLSAFNKLASGPTMKVLQRYEARYHLMYHRCINTLIKLQKNRPAPVPNESKPAMLNEPKPEPVPAGEQNQPKASLPNEPKSSPDGPNLQTHPPNPQPCSPAADNLRPMPQISV